ncbi:MAG: recombination mediator RecR [Ignavibacteriales bacterium]|nr:recombination mediator RecR [Ignavibacteriales bacterium]
MVYTSESVAQLVDELSRLPSIGRKTALRLALHILKQPRERVVALADALISVKDNVRYCSLCANITESDPCSICSNTKRNKSVICVVEEPNDVLALERTNEFHGLYHVLGGALSPLDNVGPEDLKIKELLARLDEPVQEIILALNPNVEGEATTLYLAKLLRPLAIKVSRIARGLPIGSDLEFADEATLARAIEGRVDIS